MSFSQDIKSELENVIPNARHCQLAEMAAINEFGSRKLDETTPAGRKFFTLARKTSIISRCVEANLNNSCCKRAYLRGAFLSAGSTTDPQKGYDVEFVCLDKDKADLIQKCLDSFDIDAKCTLRKGTYVVYIKEAEAVVDTLNVLGAHKSLMNLENLRAEKDFRNLINRKVNCETANIAKTVGAAGKQIEDIRKIEENMGLDKLPESLRQIAKIRLEHTESSLSELGALMDPPIGKSGVNHRLRKLSEIASTIQ